MMALVYLSDFLFINFLKPSFTEETKSSLKMKSKQKSKETQTPQAVKDLMSKLYFSRTQENYLKIYGNDNSYMQQLTELMSKANKKKLNRIIEDVKLINTGFRKYLQKKRIIRLTPEDVVEYENALDNESRRTFLGNLSGKSESNVKQLDQDIIRIGFMMILEKLTNEKADNFINQSKYLKEIIERENQNLRKLGYQYMGVDHQDKARNIMEEIRTEEKMNGNFKLIGDKIREETATLHKVADYLSSITIK